MSKIDLKVGHVYETRDGVAVAVIGFTNGVPPRFEGTNGRMYDANGHLHGFCYHWDDLVKYIGIAKGAPDEDSDPDNVRDISRKLRPRRPPAPDGPDPV